MFALIILCPALILLFIPGCAGLGVMKIKQGFGLLLTIGMIIIAAIATMVAMNSGLAAAFFVATAPTAILLLLSTE